MRKKSVLVIVILCLSLTALPVKADDGPMLGVGTITSLALSPDGSRLAVATTIGVYFYNAQTFEPQGFWPTPSAVGQVAWSPRGDVLALGRAREVDIRRVEDGALLASLPFNPLQTWGFGADGSTVAVVASDVSVVVYNVTDGTIRDRITTSSFWETAAWRLANLAPSGLQTAGGRLVVVSYYHAYAYDIARRGHLGSYFLDGMAYGYRADSFPADRAAISPDGKWLAGDQPDGPVYVWPVGHNSQPWLILRGHVGGYSEKHSFAWSPDSQVLFSAKYNTVYAWDVLTGQVLRKLDGFTTAISQVGWSVDGQRMVAVQGRDIGAWALATRQPAQAAPLERNQEGSLGPSVTEVLTSPDGKWLLISDFGGFSVYEASTLKFIRRIWCNAAAVAFSPDSKLVSTSGNTRYINLWDLTTGRSVRDLAAPKNVTFTSALAFAPDGQTLYSLENNAAIRRWSLKDGSSTSVMLSEPGKAQRFDWYTRVLPALSIGGQRLALPATDGVRLVDLNTGATLFRIDVPNPWMLKINPQGTRLAAIAGNTVKIWSLETGAQLADYQGHRELWYSSWSYTEHTISDIAFSPDGEQIASAGVDGTVRLWDVP